MPDTPHAYYSGVTLLAPAWAAANGIDCLFWTKQTTYPHQSTPDAKPSIVVGWPTAKARSERIAADVESIHSLWKEMDNRGKHPLGPLVSAWQSQPIPVTPDQRETGIMPSQVQAVRHTSAPATPTKQDAGTSALIDIADKFEFDGSLGWRSDGQGYLPSMQPEPSALAPSLPLVLYDGTGCTSLAKGQGAPLALRLFVEVVLAVPLNQRGWRTRLAIPLRDLIRFLWPNGWHSFKRDGPKLARALRQIDQARIPWDRGFWRPVSLTNLPKSKSDSVVFDVELPPGSGRGPMVYRPVLRGLGVRSAPEYRAYLGLAAMRNRYLTVNGKLIAPTIPEVRRNASGALLGIDGSVLTGKGGVPVKHWSDKRAIRTGNQLRNPALERLPWLLDADLVSLCYANIPAQSNTPLWRYTQLSKQALRKMEANGIARIEREDPSGKTERSKGRWRVILTELP